MQIEKLPVMEHFYTIQGEGTFAGNAAYFVRLAGCDVGCHWCDVKESWDMKKHPAFYVTEIVEFVIRSKALIAVITGGEPLIHNLDVLTNLLKNNGIRTHIETSGAYLPTGNWDWITLSPKKFKPTLPIFYEICNELKVIIFNISDFEFANENRNKIINKSTKMLLQAEWDKKLEMYPKIVQFVKENPKWNISVQTHKYLNIP